MLITLYKSIESKGLHYREMWFNQERNIVVVHWGKVGFIGKSEEYSMSYEEAEKYSERFILDSRKEGYDEFPEEELCTIVIQFPLKSNLGNKRDKWLGDKCSEYLQYHLSERGLGYSEGAHIENKKLNIFCIVVDEERGVSSIKTCLKTYRLDLTHAIIVARKWDDEDFRYKYSHKPIDNFSLI